MCKSCNTKCLSICIPVTCFFSLYFPSCKYIALFSFYSWYVILLFVIFFDCKCYNLGVCRISEFTFLWIYIKVYNYISSFFNSFFLFACSSKCNISICFIIEESIIHKTLNFCSTRIKSNFSCICISSPTSKFITFWCNHCRKIKFLIIRSCCEFNSSMCIVYIFSTIFTCFNKCSSFWCIKSSSHCFLSCLCFFACSSKCNKSICFIIEESIIHKTLNFCSTRIKSNFSCICISSPTSKFITFWCNHCRKIKFLIIRSCCEFNSSMCIVYIFSTIFTCFNKCSSFWCIKSSNHCFLSCLCFLLDNCCDHWIFQSFYSIISISCLLGC